jgi:peptidoglycan hydrolase-like protein with peptidoglycan-binding domain
MKKMFIALVATAALTLPAAAQQSNPNQNTGQNPDAMDQNQNGQTSGQNAGGAMGSGRHSLHLGASQTRMLQRALNRKGFNVGAVDGVMGPKTQQALSQFQQKNGLSVTGQLDRKTIAALAGGQRAGQQQNATANAGASTASAKKHQPQSQPQQGGGTH